MKHIPAVSRPLRSADPRHFTGNALVIVDPHEEHWHGAPPDEAGEHLVINLGGETVWLEESE